MQNQTDITVFIISAAMLLLIAVILLLAAILSGKKQRQQFAGSLHQLEIDHLVNLHNTELAVREETCQQISRELHDHIGNTLSLAKLHLLSLDDSPPLSRAEKIDITVKLIAETLDEVRNFSKVLHSEKISRNGLLATIQQQVEQLKQFGQFRVHLSVTGTVRSLGQGRELALFRIMQEAVNNIIKHASATVIHISLCYDNEKLAVAIHDDGSGFAVSDSISANPRGIGLKNILKRSSLIHAIAEIVSLPQQGTTINIITPY